MTEKGNSLSYVLDALSNSRRRIVLYHLIETFDERAHLDALSEVVVHETEGMAVTEESNRRIATNLRHVHLPKLSDLGFVDVENKIVRVQETPSVLNELLEVVQTHDGALPDG